MTTLLLLSAAIAGPGFFDGEERAGADDPGVLEDTALDSGFDLDETYPVTGGVIVSGSRWDGTAAIIMGRSGVNCTGVLVAPTVVLTAGHCVGGITDVLIGANNYNQGGEQIEVTDEVAYPRWNNTYDIALLKLAEPSSYPPRIIAQDCILEEDLYDGAEVAVVGWGAYDTWGNRYDSELREGFITVDDADCTDFNSGCVRSISPGGELGAGIAVDGVDSCYGDSGGPLYLPTDKGDFVVGIVSRGYNTVTVPCGEGGIYVRPDAVIDWIEEEGGVTLEAPDCSTNSPPVPTVEDLVAKKNKEVTARVAPHDPDEGQRHTLEVLVTPDRGRVEVGPGMAFTYTPNRGFKGVDTFELQVTDDGTPAMSGSVLVSVTVSGACGCASGPGGGAGAAASLAMLGLVALRRRR